MFQRSQNSIVITYVGLVMTFKYTNLVLIFGNLIKTYAILFFSVVVGSLK